MPVKFASFIVVLACAVAAHTPAAAQTPLPKLLPGGAGRPYEVFGISTGSRSFGKDYFFCPAGVDGGSSSRPRPKRR
jgi:hypothetical protein